MNADPLEPKEGRRFLCRALAPDICEAVTDFFRTIRTSGSEAFFHPHPFERADAERLCNYTGHDFYCALMDGDKMVGYGMLRGWDQGYQIPSLGICIDHRMRGRGLGELLMRRLHEFARERGAESVRLKVDSRNAVARRLYERMGYVIHEASETDLILLKHL